MEDIVKKNVLDAVHFTLKNQRQYLDLDKMKEIDEEIIPYIEENFEYDIAEFRVIHPIGSPLVGDKRIIPITVRYYAMLQDNLELLKKLEKKNFDFKGRQHLISLYALDKQLSNKFKSSQYINYLMKYGVVFEHFYNTLRGLDYKERERYLVTFSDMVKKDPTILKVGTGDGEICNFITRRNIECFGEDFLLSLDERQRKLMNSFCFQITDENALKIEELVTKYPNFRMPIPLYKDVLNCFTVDEIGTMSVKDMNLYDAAFRSDVVDRMKELLKLDSEFDCPMGFIKYEIFRVLDNETILSLSREAMEEIARIRIQELDNVYVFPVRKINKVVFKDKLKKKIDGIRKK